MAAINLNIGGDTRQLDRDIQKTVNRAYSINLKTKGDQPLGRITGKVNEFEKSLAASNARVIAFGASAGIIYGVQNAFVSLATSVVEVQKSLQDINVILNVSNSQLNKFGGELFNIAKNTGQSFKNVAEAATEFSRQGLGLEETLKRTNEALILSRLSGLDTVKSVEALTAAVNSFASQAVTATQIVNKFATVDAAFAVSSADLADAISRVGSSAAQSGVNLDELIAIVTSAQQTTARGGAVIGNSFKTIFTRLQRGKVVDLLESLGISGTSASGEVKSTIQLLTELGQVYDKLGAGQQAYVAEQVGGVFQINILKAALSDLGKEYSIYGNALKTSLTATDEAIQRNEELNKTFAAQLNALKQNITQFSGSIGESLLAPLFDRTVGNLNELLGGLNEGDANSFGAVLGKGILDGLGQVIAGPGLALVGGVLIKLFRDFSVYASGSLKDLLGLNSAAKQQGELQKSIAQIISKNPDLYALMQKGATGLNQASQILLQNLKAQTLELTTQQKLSAVIAKQLYGSGVRFSGGVPVAPTSGKPGKASGFIPNFARVSDQQKTGEIMGALDGGYIPGKVFEIGGMVLNGAEDIYKYPGVSKPEIRPPEGSKAGEEHRKKLEKKVGFVPGEGRAKGFVPNFAPANIKAIREGGIFERQLNKYFFGTETDAGNATLDFPPNVLQKVKSDEKKQIGMNPKSFFGDAKRTENRKNQRSLVSKILRTPNFQSKFFNTPPDSTGRIYIPAPGLSMLFLNEGADKGQIASLGINGIDGSKSVGKNTQEIIKSYYQKQGLDPRGEYRVQVPYIADQIRASSLPVLDSGKRITNKTAPTNSLGIPRGFGKKNFASGFIPNFAKIIDLGDTVTAPQLKGKVSSLIHPKVTGGQEKRGVTANYLGQQYKGLVTTAGINQAEIKNTVPDLEKNLGRILVDEANQFGQAIGGQNFLKSPDELPNYGAVKGAVGNAFEGGVTTLLQRNLQKSSQTAGIDFTQQRMTAKMKRLFHGAPGTYEAKYSPDLANEVLGKMLKAANVGGVKQAKSGSGYKANQALRAEALKNLQGQNLRRGPQLETAIKAEMARLNRTQGMAAGYIPNFAAQQIAEVMALETAMSGEKATFNTKPFPHVRNKSQPTFGSAMADHGGKKQALKDSLMGQKRAGLSSGFIPNFAVGESSEPADLTASIGALITQLGGLAFMLSFSKDGIKNSLQEMVDNQKTASGMTVADAQLKQGAIKEEIAAANSKKAVLKEEMATAKKGSKEAKDLAREHKNATAEVKKLNQAQSALSKQIQGTKNRGDVGTATRGQKFGAAIGGNAMAIGMIAPILAETAKNAIGGESRAARTGGAVASGLGSAASMAAMGGMVGGVPGAVVGAAVGVTMGFVDVIKQASTDLPEFTAASQKASEALSRVTESSQNILTGFNQLESLKDAGSEKQAAELKASLKEQVMASFEANPTNIKGAAQAMAAIDSGDFKMLSEALQENAKAVTEQAAKTKKEEGATKFREDNTGGVRGKTGMKNFKESFDASVLKSSNLPMLTGEKLQAFNQQLSEIKIGDMFKKGPETEKLLSDLLSQIGVTNEDFKKLGLESGTEIGLAFASLTETVRRRAGIEKEALKDSVENSDKLRVLTNVLARVFSQYREISKNAASNAKLEFELSNQRKELSAEFGKTVLEGRSEVSKTLGVSSSGQRSIENQERVLGINQEYDKTITGNLEPINADIADLISSSFDFKQQKLESKQGLEGKTNLERTEEQARQAQLLNPGAIKSDIAAAMGAFNAGENTFNLKTLEAKLSAGIDTNDKDAKTKLQAILDKASAANDIAKKAEQTRKAQLAILAQQNINQLAQEFAAATVASFGGFQAEYLDKDKGDKSFATGVGDVMMERQRYVDSVRKRIEESPMDGGVRGALTESETQELGRRSGNVYSQIEKMVGRPLGLASNGDNLELQKQEIAGRASQLKEQRAQIQSEAGSDPAVAQALLKAAEQMAQQTGFADEFATIIAGTKEGSQERTSMIDTLMNREGGVLDKTAKVQSDELRNTGSLEKMFFEAAAKALPEDQQKALKEAGASGMELFKETGAIQLQTEANTKLQESNEFLKEIRDSIKEALNIPSVNAPVSPAPATQGAQSASNNTTVSPTVNINLNGANGAQVNAEGMSAETAKVLEENKDRILAAGGLADKVANLENAVYSQDPSKRPPPKSDYYRNAKYK